MRALVFHLSSLVGLLVFLNQLWNAAELEQTIFVAFSAGLVMYTLLMIGFAVTRRILEATPPSGQGVEEASKDNTRNPIK